MSAKREIKPKLTFFFEEGSDMLSVKIYHNSLYKTSPLFPIGSAGWNGPYLQDFGIDNRHYVAFRIFKEYITARSEALWNEGEKHLPTVLGKEIKALLPNNSLHDLEAFAFNRNPYMTGESLESYEWAFRKLTGKTEGDYDLTASGCEIVFFLGEDEYLARSSRILKKKLTEAVEKSDPEYIETTESLVWDEVMTDPDVTSSELIPEIIRVWKDYYKDHNKASGEAENLLDYLQRINSPDPVSQAEFFGLMGLVVLAYLHCYNADACIDEYIEILTSYSDERVISYHKVDYIFWKLE